MRLRRASAHELIRAALPEVTALMKETFDAVGGSPIPGRRLDQVYLLDGADVVEDYLRHGEPGVAFDHLIYMIEEPDLKISDATYALIVEIRRRLNRDPEGGDRMRWAGVSRQVVDMNGAMRALDPPRLWAFDARRRLDPRLADVLSGGFEERNGCIVLASQVGSVDRLRLTAFDETETEAIANHVHVEDVLATVSPHETVLREELVRPSPSETLQQTMAYVACLEAGLIDGRPNDAFHIVVAVGDSYTVRFYKLRSDQPAFVADDLDGYATEAVMVMNVQP